jgi:hypothetical protein
MEHRFIINYQLDGQPESLEVITESEDLTPDEARKSVETATKPYGKTNVENIEVVKVKVAEVIDTDPATSASE